MGLYGNVLVEPADPEYWPPANREVILTLDDILLKDKAMLFKEFAGVDAFPLCIDTKDVNEMTTTTTMSPASISSGFEGQTSTRRELRVVGERDEPWLAR